MLKNVLIVDDDQKLLKMLRRTLIYEGYDVVTATDGRGALETIYAQHPDVVILDWMMPELDGLDVLTALRDDENEIPVLMLTAKGQSKDRDLALALGANAYLTKPFSNSEMVETLNRVAPFYASTWNQITY